MEVLKKSQVIELTKSKPRPHEWPVVSKYGVHLAHRKKILAPEVLEPKLRKEIIAKTEKLINRAKSKGMYENFGEKEIRELKDKYDYNSLRYGTNKERELAIMIDQFESWASGAEYHFLKKADVQSYTRLSRKGLFHKVRDHKRMDPSKRVSLRLMQVLDGMKYKQKKDLHDKIMGQIKDVKSKVLKGEGTIADVFGLVKLTTDLEKARVQVKPYQRKGRMVLGYSQERRAGVGEGQPNYDKGIKEIASDVRADLKKRFPDCKFSVTIERYSMGQSLHINLMEAPFDVLEPVERVEEYYRREHPTGKSEQDIGSLMGHQKYALENGYAQLNEYQILKPTWEKERLSNGVMLTEKGWQMLQKVCGIALKDHYDHSDPMTDYFDTNYYFHLNIGKWNKPFVKTGDMGQVGESQTKYGIKYDPKKMEAFIAKDAFLQFVAKRGMDPEVMFNTYIVGDSAMENAYLMADIKAFDFRKFAKEFVGGKVKEEQSGYERKPTTPQEVRKLIRAEFPNLKFQVKNVGFSDLARGSSLFVTSNEWNPEIYNKVREILKPLKVIVSG